MAEWLILLLLFPVICAVIGYVTNVLAVKMIFRPHKEIRLAGIGIQGVLPKHQRHFARMLAGIIIRDFMGLRSLVLALNQPETVDRIEGLARRLAPMIADELRVVIPENRQALLSDATIKMVTDQVVAEARKRAPDLVEALANRAEETVDLEAIMTEKIMLWGPEGLERVIYDVSKKELDFIEYYGAIFGFALGLLQWTVLQLAGNWALPVVGVLVGTVTNWLAIQMLFYPREPTVYLGFVKYQGLFPKRQFEMAEKMGTIASKELIIPSEIFGELADTVMPPEPSVADVLAVEAIARREVPHLFQVADALVDDETRPALHARLAKRTAELLPDVKKELLEAATAAIDVDSLLSEELKKLEKSEFEQLLRGLFEREEIYLIIYGGLLGGLIGLLQLGLVRLVG